MKKDVVIQINSNEALDRLIGDDPNLRVSLRNSVVQEFSKKYFKNIANEISEDAITRTMIDEFNKMFKEVKVGTYRKEKVLKTEHSEAIKELVKKEFSAIVSDKMSSLWKESSTKFQERVDAWSNDMANVFSEKKFIESVEKAADDKIKQKLGL